MAIKSKIRKSKSLVHKERTSHKAVICTRVSTTEQEDNHSLKAQRDRLIDYCKRHGFEIIREFEIVESSTT
jgi:DNA invertase Pin-like site-specific DNA recombinase